ncbi:MAG: tetraacyldisaccharide 4'-kinase [Bacteroidota bacterium]
MRWLRRIAWPFSLLYGLVVNIRNILYDYGLLRSTAFATPTICVGNLSVGGTGKTPMIEYLITALQPKYKLAVLSRGYKRSSKGFVLAQKDSTVATLGDEPFQIYQKFPDTALAVDADRCNGIRELEKQLGPDLILLDDAYQHRRVNPTFAILLTTFAKPYTEDWYLPTGDLRDARYAARRADCIVVTKCPAALTASAMEAMAQKLAMHPSQPVVFATLVYDSYLYSENTKTPLQQWKQSPFTLVTGIANPTPLVDYLKAQGLVFEHLAFPDHHNFSNQELALLSTKNNIVTTEKDYARLQFKLAGLHYVKVAHSFLEGGDQLLLAALHQQLKHRR